jgi:hypothetical protein
MSLTNFRVIGHAITRKDISFDLSAESEWHTETSDLEIHCPYCEALLDPIDDGLMIN